MPGNNENTEILSDFDASLKKLVNEYEDKFRSQSEAIQPPEDFFPDPSLPKIRRFLEGGDFSFTVEQVGSIMSYFNKGYRQPSHRKQCMFFIQSLLSLDVTEGAYKPSHENIAKIFKKKEPRTRLFILFKIKDDPKLYDKFKEQYVELQSNTPTLEKDIIKLALKSDSVVTRFVYFFAVLSASSTSIFLKENRSNLRMWYKICYSRRALAIFDTMKSLGLTTTSLKLLYGSRNYKKREFKKCIEKFKRDAKRKRDDADASSDGNGPAKRPKGGLGQSRIGAGFFNCVDDPIGNEGVALKKLVNEYEDKFRLQSEAIEPPEDFFPDPSLPKIRRFLEGGDFSFTVEQVESIMSYFNKGYRLPSHRKQCMFFIQSLLSLDVTEGAYKPSHENIAKIFKKKEPRTRLFVLFKIKKDPELYDKFKEQYVELQSNTPESDAPTFEEYIIKLALKSDSVATRFVCFFAVLSAISTSTFLKEDKTNLRMCQEICYSRRAIAIFDTMKSFGLTATNLNLLYESRNYAKRKFKKFIEDFKGNPKRKRDDGDASGDGNGPAKRPKRDLGQSPTDAAHVLLRLHSGVDNNSEGESSFSSVGLSGVGFFHFVADRTGNEGGALNENSDGEEINLVTAA